jgi:3-hydroxyacyl-CoA dehydrogenase
LKTTCPNSPSCDWVIEAVTENLGIKQALLTRVLPHLGPRAILTTNTSGLPIGQIAASLGDAFTPSLRQSAGSARTSSIPRATCACWK